MNKANFIYVTYIATTPEKLWRALVDTDTMRQYWKNPIAKDSAHINVSDWKPGSRWEHQRDDDMHTLDIVGKVFEYTPPRRLALTWARILSDVPQQTSCQSHRQSDSLERCRRKWERADARLMSSMRFTGLSDVLHNA